MAYQAVTDEQVDAKSSINEDLKQTEQGNAIDHETRVLSLENNENNYTSVVGVAASDTDTGTMSSGTILSDTSDCVSLLKEVDNVISGDSGSGGSTTIEEEASTAWYDMTDAPHNYTHSCPAGSILFVKVRCKIRVSNVAADGWLRVKITTQGNSELIIYSDEISANNSISYFTIEFQPLMVVDTGTNIVLQMQSKADASGSHFIYCDDSVFEVFELVKKVSGSYRP